MSFCCCALYPKVPFFIIRLPRPTTMGRRWQAPAVATLSIFAAACLFRERQTLTIAALSSTDQRPDILLVVLDDVGHNDVAWGSNATDLAGLTPTLEALARRGVVLDT
jgi:hypothetical protein